MRTNRTSLLLAVAAALLVGSCGSSPESSSPAALANPSPLVLAGTIAGNANFGTNPRGCVTGWTAVLDLRGEDLSMGPVAWHSEHCLDMATLQLCGAGGLRRDATALILRGHGVSGPLVATATSDVRSARPSRSGEPPSVTEATPGGGRQ